MFDVSHRDYSVKELRSINFECASLSFKTIFRVFGLMVLCPQQQSQCCNFTSGTKEC